MQNYKINVYAWQLPLFGKVVFMFAQQMHPVAAYVWKSTCHKNQQQQTIKIWKRPNAVRLFANPGLLVNMEMYDFIQHLSFDYKVRLAKWKWYDRIEIRHKIIKHKHIEHTQYWSIIMTFDFFFSNNLMNDESLYVPEENVRKTYLSTNNYVLLRIIGNNLIKQNINFILFFFFQNCVTKQIRGTKQWKKKVILIGSRKNITKK